jgi:hypothetical protein
VGYRSKGPVRRHVPRRRPDRKAKREQALEAAGIDPQPS